MTVLGYKRLLLSLFSSSFLCFSIFLVHLAKQRKARGNQLAVLQRDTVSGNLFFLFWILVIFEKRRLFHK